MSEVKNCSTLLQPPRSSHHKKKKKKKASIAAAPESKEKPLALLLAPDTFSVSLLSHPDPGPGQDHLPKLEVFCKKNRELCTGCSQKTKNCCEDSQFLLTAAPKTRTNGSPAPVTKLRDQGNQSLRWEGVLQDPQEEAKRLEVYRANRRQRYVAHREALSKETQHSSRQTLLKER